VPVGVDAEQWGRIRSPELFAASLSEQERSALGAIPAGQQSEHLLALWCAKEAAAKCLGTGLQGQPEKFEVRFLDAAGHSAQVVHDDMQMEVSLYRDAQTVIALAVEQGSAEVS
jgi:phosphopantetheine--protein transferase-like protein